MFSADENVTQLKENVKNCNIFFLLQKQFCGQPEREDRKGLFCPGDSNTARFRLLKFGKSELKVLKLGYLSSKLLFDNWLRLLKLRKSGLKIAFFILVKVLFLLSWFIESTRK